MSFIDNALGISPQALTFRSQRSDVLAKNIANADTPGFKSRDFDFREALKTELNKSVGMEATNQRHIPIQQESDWGGLLYRVPTKLSANGNTVESEVEQAAFSDNAMRYQASIQFLNGSINGLRKAIKGGQ